MHKKYPGILIPGVVLFALVYAFLHPSSVQASMEEAKQMLGNSSLLSVYNTDIPKQVSKEWSFPTGFSLGIAGKHVRIARAVEKELEITLGKSLPINVDGAIAAVLCELGIPPEIGNAFFIIARVPGLVAHIQEEWTRMRPMRKIHPQDHAYDGPEEREL